MTAAREESSAERTLRLALLAVQRQAFVEGWLTRADQGPSTSLTTHEESGRALAAWSDRLQKLHVQDGPSS